MIDNSVWEIALCHVRCISSFFNCDPMFACDISAYRHIKQYTRDYGIQIDYDQYKRMKNSYEEAAKKHGAGSQIDFSGR